MRSVFSHIERSASWRAALAILAIHASACSAAGGDSSPSAAGAAGGGGGGGTGGGGDAGLVVDSSGGGDDPSCAAKTYGAMRVPASVLLLLDRSASMADCAGDTQCTESKWVGAKNAIQGALSAAPPELRVGLTLFPAAVYGGYDQCRTCMTNSMLQGAVPAGCEPVLADCGCHDITPSADVPIQELSASLPQINAKLAASEPDYNTPTYHALAAAYQMMSALPNEGDRYVLLLTDGDPTVHTLKQQVFVPPFNYYDQPEMYNECLALEDILAQAQGAATASSPVRTFVVGSPGVQNTRFLSDLARAGATPKAPGCEATDSCHYQIGQGNFATELQAVLTDIAGQVATCTFAIPVGSDQVDPNRVNVSYQIGDGASQQLYMDPSRQDGWDYTDDSHTQVEVYGPACETIKENTESAVTISLGCKTLVK